LQIIRNKKISTISSVYFTFKRIITSHTDAKDAVSSIRARLNHIDMTVMYPFLLALFSHEEKQEITHDDVQRPLSCIESFIPAEQQAEKATLDDEINLTGRKQRGIKPSARIKRSIRKYIIKNQYSAIGIITV